MNLEAIREAERKSHEEIYSTAKLFEKGSWLQKPVKTVMDILPLFEGYSELNILDLGCGVGRNSIPIAQLYKSINCRIDCVDILEMAIDKLGFYSNEYGVSDSINGILTSIEDFEIIADTYDFILSVSSLEHIKSEFAFIDKIYQIRNGIRDGGVVCLIVNSEVTEINKESRENVAPQFEVNLETDVLRSVINETFADWQVLKSSVVCQNYEIPREGYVSELTTNIVTFVARKH